MSKKFGVDFWLVPAAKEVYESDEHIAKYTTTSQIGKKINKRSKEQRRNNWLRNTNNKLWVIKEDFKEWSYPSNRRE